MRYGPVPGTIFLTISCPITQVYRAGSANSTYSYRLTDKGVKAALMFILFQKRVCGPLANSLFNHRPDATLKPASRVETAYYKADRAPILYFRRNTTGAA
jgi:hypothetical protein